MKNVSSLRFELLIVSVQKEKTSGGERCDPPENKTILFPHMIYNDIHTFKFWRVGGPETNFIEEYYFA